MHVEDSLDIFLHFLSRQWWDPFLDPTYAGASVHRVALLFAKYGHDVFVVYFHINYSGPPVRIQDKWLYLHIMLIFEVFYLESAKKCKVADRVRNQFYINDRFLHVVLSFTLMYYSVFDDCELQRSITEEDKNVLHY
jgi:hypothetical protein